MSAATPTISVTCPPPPAPTPASQSLASRSRAPGDRRHGASCPVGGSEAPSDRRSTCIAPPQMRQHRPIASSRQSRTAIVPSGAIPATTTPKIKPQPVGSFTMQPREDRESNANTASIISKRTRQLRQHSCSAALTIVAHHFHQRGKMHAEHLHHSHLSAGAIKVTRSPNVGDRAAPPRPLSPRAKPPHQRAARHVAIIARILAAEGQDGRQHHHRARTVAASAIIARPPARR